MYDFLDIDTAEDIARRRREADAFQRRMTREPFAFMSSSYQGSDAWQFNAEEEAKARKRGTVFTPEQFKAIVGLWADAMNGSPRHEVDRLVLPSATGAVVIRPHGIHFEKEPSAEQMRASMAHIAEVWGGKAVIPMGKGTEFRLKARAYAEVYGIELRDTNDSFLAQRFTKDELARLPQMRADIRKAHADAPPARPNEEKALAAMYAARYPHRVPEPS